MCFKTVSDFTTTVSGTAGTGGFGIKNISVAYYNSPYIDGVITVFMLIFGMNFNLFYLVLLRDFKSVFKNEELRVYLGITITVMVIIAFNILHLYDNFFEAFRYAAFQVNSIITTTGYSTTDFNR